MDHVRPEYPRPHFDRSHAWRTLNGEWEFRRDGARDLDAPAAGEANPWEERITVPFAWETEASGIGAHWLRRAWYRRSLDIPAEWSDERVVLHFGAVHHNATVWVNGTEVGEHEGGYVPFEVDITDALRPASNTLLVRVDAPTDKRYIAHGKQRSLPRDDYDSCSFTPSSGIWQPVWLESRPRTHIAAVRVVPSPQLDAFDVTVDIDGPDQDRASIVITLDGEEPFRLTPGAGSARIPLRQPRLWSPTDPQLYTVTVASSAADGDDNVIVSAGLRTIETRGEQLFLNGEPLYVRGVLDQGYWPRTGITAPTDQAFVDDLQLAREAGFNLVRKHLKLEDPRFLHHADLLGMLVWAEPTGTGRFSQQSARRFEAQIEPMVARDGNHPSIVIWGLYNEEWGLDWDVAGDPVKQDAVRRAASMLRAIDSTRPIVDNSGWSHVDTDLIDWHIYDDTPAWWAEKLRSLLAEGTPTFPVGLGPGFVVQKHLTVPGSPGRAGRPNLNSEFGGGGTSVERGWNLRWQTLELRRYASLSGYVYTELYDIEHEMAGIYDAERAPKDNGGNPPAESNAETVLIPEIVPLAPGRDVESDTSALSFGLRIAHSGTEPIDGELVAVWGPLLEPLRLSDLDEGSSVSAVHASPVSVSDAFLVAVQRPGPRAGRLHLVLQTAAGAIATTSIDVADAAAPVVDEQLETEAMNVR